MAKANTNTNTNTNTKTKTKTQEIDNAVMLQTIFKEKIMCESNRVFDRVQGQSQILQN